jgi:hypothetical protein
VDERDEYGNFVVNYVRSGTFVFVDNPPNEFIMTKKWPAEVRI